MNPAEAKEVLLFHSFAHEDIDHPKMGGGFLGSLRPFDGRLKEENFHEVMEALRILAPALEQPSVDREIVSSIWHICHLGRMWGVHPGGMLRRNGLISAEESARLERWIDCISYATMMLLGGSWLGDRL